MASICKTHGDLKAACRELHNNSMYCDGQGTYIVKRHGDTKYAICPACEKLVSLRADSTIRAHNGRGR